MSTRDRIAKALTEALKPLGWRLHDHHGVKVLVVPTCDMFKVYIEPIPTKAKP